ncbi:MAG: fatty acid desaturase family protein [Pseudomonadota bacterium]
MRVTDYLSKAELEYFRSASDLHAVWQVAVNYALIVGAFVLFGIWPNPVTALIGAALLAGRILGLGILMHDAAHRSLFTNPDVNRHVARWLLAGPVLGDAESYRRGHLLHHKQAGTEKDPDLAFVRAYPVPRASIRRKFFRDLTGRTGFRDLLYVVSQSTIENRLPSIVWHAAVLGALTLAGMWYAYPLFWVGYLFIYPAFMRMRVMGEHGNVENILDRDPRNNTRTTLAGPLARLFIAPNFVNFHCEHHMLANVPGPKLPRLHKMLSERGFYKDHPWAVEPSYRAVLNRCTGERADRVVFAASNGAASMENMS